MSSSTSDHVEDVLSPTVPAAIPSRTKLITIEPALFLFFLAWSISSIPFENELIKRTCTVILGKDQLKCDQLFWPNKTDEIKIIESQVQPYVANITMTKSLIEGIFSALVCIFIGPWSDRFGRKPIIKTALLGYHLSFIITAMIAFLSKLMPVNPWFYLAGTVPVAFCGGSCALISAVFCHATDTTVDKERAIKMGFFQASIYAGLLSGTVINMFKAISFSTFEVMIVGSLLVGISYRYTVVYVKESVTNDRIQQQSSLFRDLYKLESVYEIISSGCKRRPGFNRLIIWFIIISLGTTVFVMEGDATVYYLFTRKMFDWSLPEFSSYEAVSLASQIMGNIIGLIVLSKILKMTETSLALIAFASAIIDCVIKGEATMPIHLYIAIGASFLKSFTSPMCRTVLSQVVPKEDIGKVMTLTTAIESLTPLAAAPLYAYIYKQTLETSPGMFNFTSAGLFGFCFILMLVIRCLFKKYTPERYATLQEELEP